jgi:probable HAF family extracellular repeat protein
VLWLPAHSGRKIFSRTFPELWKDFETATQLRCGTEERMRSGKTRPTQILVQRGALGNAECCHGRPVRLGPASALSQLNAAFVSVVAGQSVSRPRPTIAVQIVRRSDRRKLEENIMKLAKLTSVTAIVLLTILAVPLHLAAQGKQGHHHEYHHYQLIDVGTLGGPNSGLSGPDQQTLNNRGTFAAYANTSTPNPNPGCFVPFNNNDCFIEHPVVWHDGAATDLGVLPGGANGQTDSISAGGLIDGWSENGLIDPLTGLPQGRAVLWTKDRKVIDLGTVQGGNESLAASVNSSAQVVGFSDNNIPEDVSISLAGFPTQTRAFLWKNGVMQDLGTLGGTDSLAFNVNEWGQVTGFSYTDSDSTLNPFLWENGTMTNLGTFGGTFGVANWLNNRGQVAGTSNLSGDATNHGFLWDKGTLTDLGTLGGDNSEGDWISDSGFVVGRADVPGSQSHHAFRWKNGMMADLGMVQPWPCSTAYSVNSAGQVVGETGICGVGGGPAFFSDHGEPMVDVNSLIIPASHLEVVDAFDINDRGEIAGAGLLPNGDVHAVLLIPCDENHSGMAGCDNSLLDATAAAQVHTPQVAQARSVPMQNGIPIGLRGRLASRMARRFHMPGGLDGSDR